MTDYEWSDPVSISTLGAAGLGYPGLLVEADYTSAPLTIPTDWTSIPRFRAVSISQGRQRLLNRTEVGQATVTVDNLERGYDPTVHPEVRPSNHLRIRAVVGTQIIDLFRGFVRSWPQEWPGKMDAISRVEVEDGFALMARYEMEGDEIEEMASGPHIREVLTNFGWPEAGAIPDGSDWWVLGTSLLGDNTVLGESLAQVDGGLSVIMATELTGNLLAHLLNVAEETEGGTFYIGPSGDIVFRQRQVGGDEPIGTWGDATGENRYTDLLITYDDSVIYNDIRLTRRGDSEAITASDDLSIEAYGPRTLQISDLLHAESTETEERAANLILKHKDAALYPQRLVMRPKPDSNLWPTILGIPLGTQITVRRRPPGDGDMIELSCAVIGVQYDVSPDFWEITWSLAEAPVFLEPWLLGVVGRSELGTTTALAAGAIEASVQVSATAGIATVGAGPTSSRSAALSAIASIAVAGGPANQIARPATTTSSNWTLNIGGTDMALWISDESDSTFASGAGGSSRNGYGTFEDLTDPLSSSGHVLHVRATATVGTGSGSVSLYQGDPGGAGTVIHASTIPENGVLEVTSTTLSAGETDSITNYADLYWYAEKSGNMSLTIYEVWFEIT